MKTTSSTVAVIISARKRKMAFSKRNRKKRLKKKISSKISKKLQSLKRLTRIWLKRTKTSCLSRAKKRRMIIRIVLLLLEFTRTN